MGVESEQWERAPLESLSTAELVKQALAEARLLVKAEILHAKHELKEEVRAARTAGILLGAAAVLALAGLGALVVAVGLALPLGAALGVLLAGLVVLVLAGALAWTGKRRLPTHPIPHTQERLKTDLARARETLQ